MGTEALPGAAVDRPSTQDSASRRPALSRLREASGILAPVVVALVVAAIYGVSLAHWFRAGHSAGEFVHVGQAYFERGGDSSPAIRQGPVKPTSWTGYDGQFFYYIALDPGGAAPYIDRPSYRYQRIAYPLEARLIALGRPSLTPDALLAANLLAVGLGTAALAAWLIRRGVTPWAAAVWGLLPSQLIAIQTDLSEPSAYGWVAVALWVRDRFQLLAGAAFGLDGLTRETTLLFPAVILAADLLALRGERRPWPWLRALLAATLAIGPFLAWKLFLLHWLGRADVPLTDDFTLIPFGGLLPNHAAHELVPGVVIPGLVFLGAAGWALWRRYFRVEVALLLVNLAVLVVFASTAVYLWWPNALRVELGVCLAAVLLMAVLPERRWFWFASGMWLWVTPLLLLHPI